MITTARWVLLALAIGLGCGGPTTGTTSMALPPPGPNEVRLVPLAGPPWRESAWVAARDGDGPWTRLSASAGVHRFVATSGRYTLATACPSTGAGSVTQATTAELPEVRDLCLAEPVPTFRLTGAIRGATPGAKPQVSFGVGPIGAVSAKIAADGLSYTADLPAGSYELVANEGGATPRLLVLSGVMVTGPGTTDVDFASGTRATVARPIAVTGLAAGEQLQTTMAFIGKGGGSARWLGHGMAPIVPMLPAAALGTGEGQHLEVVAYKGLVLSESRSIAIRLTGEPPPVTLPPPLVVKNVGAGPAGTLFRPQVELAPYSEALVYNVYVASARDDAGLAWLVRSGARWLGEQATTTLAFPDLTAAPGFDPAWGPVRSRSYAVTTTVLGGTVSLLELQTPLRRTDQPWTITTATSATSIEAPP